MRFIRLVGVVSVVLGAACGGSSGGGGAGSGAFAGAGPGGFGGAGLGAAAGAGGGAAGTTGLGVAGTVATAGTLGSAGTVATAGASAVAGTGAAGTGGNVTGLDPFSFFVTSLKGLQDLSGSDKGFGGDLRYGQADGLAGADKICSDLAERSMPGSSAKNWRAFLSVTNGPAGIPVHAIERIGAGPWYDRAGRLVSMDIEGLLMSRPNADPAIRDDLPNEDGVGNHAPDGVTVDNHHMLTGSGTNGKLYAMDMAATCNDWTSSAPPGSPRIGFSWPVDNRVNWISGQSEGGCGPDVNLYGMGGSKPGSGRIGSGGGYGGFYCFALSP